MHDSGNLSPLTSFKSGIISVINDFQSIYDPINKRSKENKNGANHKITDYEWVFVNYWENLRPVFDGIIAELADCETIMNDEIIPNMDLEKRLSAELVQAELEGNSNNGFGRDRRGRG
jgi:hypothetical protein